MESTEQSQKDLDITVRRYAALVQCPGFTADELRDFQLPETFPFLVNRHSGQIVETAFRYLYERVRGYARYNGQSNIGPVRHPRWKKTRVISIGTATAAADNLRLWFGYLGYIKKEWDEAGASDIHAYGRGLSRVISSKTGDFLTTGTTTQRLSHVLEFYRWANARGDVQIDPRNLEVEQFGVAGATSAPRVRALTYEEWARLRKVIGPLPSESKNKPRHLWEAPCRDRLICEIAVHTGMRRHEICALTIYQIQSLEAKLPLKEAGQEFAAKGLWLTVVKGGARRARDAIMPVWLIRELICYIDGEERSEAAKIYASNHRKREPSNLFLNHAWSHRAPGEPLSPKRLTARFTEIILEAGFIERFNHTYPSTRAIREAERPSHSIHDLRHTAAVWRYMVERKLGNPDPWKPVQVMLGHAHKETTQRIYLQITNAFEAEVSDAALQYFRGIALTAPYTQVIDT